MKDKMMWAWAGFLVVSLLAGGLAFASNHRFTHEDGENLSFGALNASVFTVCDHATGQQFLYIRSTAQGQDTAALAPDGTCK